MVCLAVFTSVNAVSQVVGLGLSFLNPSQVPSKPAPLCLQAFNSDLTVAMTRIKELEMNLSDASVLYFAKENLKLELIKPKLWP